MLVVPILLRLCLLLLPLTVVGHPANPSSSSKTIDTRGSRDAIEGLHGYVRMLGYAKRLIRRRSEDKRILNPTWTPGEMIAKPKPPASVTSNPFNITALASAKNNAFPFDKVTGPLEISGFVDLDNLDVELELYVLKFALGVFKCNLEQKCIVDIDTIVAQGTVVLYLKNKHEVWLMAKLSLPIGKPFAVNKKIFDLPSSEALAGGTTNGTVTNSGVPVAPPVNGTLSTPTARIPVATASPSNFRLFSDVAEAAPPETS